MSDRMGKIVAYGGGPHYHDSPDRRPKFKEMVLHRGGHGVAMDDGAGIEVVDGCYRVLSCLRGKVYSVRRVRGGIIETVIPATRDFHPQAEMYAY
jgi:hypothetical protein